jgi:hypothetical protein
MTPADRLRLEAAELRLRADALDALAADITRASAPDGASSPVERSTWVGLREIATSLGLSYDAARMRVDRAGVGRSIAGQKLAPRSWLDEQRAAVRSVRSLSEHDDPAAQ